MIPLLDTTTDCTKLEDALVDGPTTSTLTAAWTILTHSRSTTSTNPETLSPSSRMLPMYDRKKTHFCLTSFLPVVKSLQKKITPPSYHRPRRDTPKQTTSRSGGRRKTAIRWRRPHRRDWRTTMNDHPQLRRGQEPASRP